MSLAFFTVKGFKIQKTIYTNIHLWICLLFTKFNFPTTLLL